ncbi:unnamed protein product [Schistosoma mattheei]|uniref:Uncharacterized protein n=1 Tax=Schistosoma mattheei TaxID=31246 RepID=A0A183PLP9_9TREM|nr:unnamed protein product [Schistosoma mattheei]
MLSSQGQFSKNLNKIDREDWYFDVSHQILHTEVLFSFQDEHEIQIVHSIMDFLYALQLYFDVFWSQQLKTLLDKVNCFFLHLNHLVYDLDGFLLIDHVVLYKYRPH